MQVVWPHQEMTLLFENSNGSALQASFANSIRKIPALQLYHHPFPCSAPPRGRHSHKDFTPPAVKISIGGSEAAMRRLRTCKVTSS
mmetsp:Transcript_55753/g.110764  ORF Transcript_55753/g.110764 Transcript_55753/m.110764 type:complete len:86 (-) Transcript_55753:513-770(-)